jgi:hypothetical protein
LTVAGKVSLVRSLPMALLSIPQMEMPMETGAGVGRQLRTLSTLPSPSSYRVKQTGYSSTETNQSSLTQKLEIYISYDHAKHSFLHCSNCTSTLIKPSYVKNGRVCNQIACTIPPSSFVRTALQPTGKAQSSSLQQFIH